MWSSPIFWIFIAVMVFWALGAYNRLMRLRSAVVQAFGAVDVHLVRLVALLGEFSVSCDVAEPHGAVSAGGTGLQDAIPRLGAALALARAQPLHLPSLVSLAGAHQAMVSLWISGVMQPSPGPLTALMGPWQARWVEQRIQIDAAISVFNQAVNDYNDAIDQVPARILARAFGFQPAGPL